MIYRRTSWIGVAIVALGTVARAEAPTVAVMPFSDLSSSGGTVGEAIRETVTTDLREVPGLRVIERARIEQVLAEQRLQATRAKLDPASSAHVGKLLGATLIVTGAYQKVAQEVRFTARFVRVETGEIVGSAKIDGKAVEFLSLQDRVTAELLKSAGLAHEIVKRARPRLKSVRTMELYGDAVLAEDDGKKQKLLIAALDEDPGFTYAVHDLEALEKRIKSLTRNAHQQEDALIASMQEKLLTEKNPDELHMIYNRIFGRLMTQRRWRRIIAECKQVRAAPPGKPTHDSVPNINEFCGFYTVLAASQTDDPDTVLREGESFLAKYPTSIWFDTVRRDVENAITHKRKEKEDAPRARAALAALPPAQKADPCAVFEVYRHFEQYRDERAPLEKCINLTTGNENLSRLYQALEYACERAGDFACQRRAIEAYEKVDPKRWENVHANMSLIGRDD